MGCSNARLLVQQPLTGETTAGTTNRLSMAATHSPTDTSNAITRMHLTGVDLVVEKNGSYTLLLTPETHKQLMPYVLRKKRFRILVDKPRAEPTFISNEQVVMENSKDSKKRKTTIEAVEQMASDEHDKTKTRILGGRSIDRIDVDNDEEYIHSDDEGMIEEIVTTVEQDKDLECKIKKKIETKKTIAQHPTTNSTITKVVKTEVTEITRTITINDHHDLERAKRELGIDDVNRLLPSSTWLEQQSRSTTSQTKEKRYEPINEIVTSKDFPHDSPIKKSVQANDEKTILAESTSVGRGPVTETIVSTPSNIETKSIEIKKKKKKLKFCSCTRSSAEDEQEPSQPQPQPKAIIVPKQETSIQSQKLISDDLKQLITEKKTLLIEYLHSKIFLPANLFSSNDQNTQAKQISSRILDLLSSDRYSSWSQLSEQLTQEYINDSVADQCLKPMINTYEKLFTTKQANLLNTFSTIHNENDIENIHENNDYLNIAQTHIHQSIDETSDDKPDVIQSIEKEEKVIQNDDIDEQEIKKELEMPIENQESLPDYNEEYLIKILGDISQHKPITLAEAIAYQYFDIEDPKLGLSNEKIQRIKSLYRPLNDESTSNVIRVKRSGEHLTDINLSETNPFEQFTQQQQPFVYDLQQTFEPTLDFNEKQFRSLIDALNNSKNQYDDIEFDVARTTVPIYDLKELSANDFSQSDSGYSMTTATYESLANKIKIEFEPIQQELGPLSDKDVQQQDEIEKIDLDKATPEQLEQYELNQELIQAIKSDYNGTDKTVGQAILSRQLRLDSSDLNDIAYLKSLGIYDEQKRILTAFFFPKQTRIIAYSPEPGRFVEAQTTFNPEYPGYKTDTTIIQIQEKQLSSDQFAKQRSIQEEPIITSQIVEIEEIKTVESPAKAKKEILPTIVPVKKRKSSGCGGLLSCFKSKKAKSGTEQQGQPTIVVTTATEVQEIKTPVDEKPFVDLAVLPDGRRIYIDIFRDRPGLDMSYRPDDFENRFVLPELKPDKEYERPITPVIETDDEPLLIQSNLTDNEIIVQSDIEPSVSTVAEDEPHETTVESVDIQSEAPPAEEPEPIEEKTESTEVITESVEEKTETETHLEPRELAPIVEAEHHVHLIPRPATIEPVDVQPDVPPTIVPLHKSEEKKVVKKSLTIDLHPAAVDLPEVELVKPGPLPTLPILSTLTKEKKETKVKKSSVGLCAACFGAKSAQKKKKSLAAEPVPAPIELEKNVIEEKQVETTTAAPIIIERPDFSSVDIDTFRERDYLKSSEHPFIPSESRVEYHQQSAPQEHVTTISPDISVFSNVNIDTFLDRTLTKGAEITVQPEQHPTTITTAIVSSSEEPVTTSATPSPLSMFSQVNIDTFRERSFEKSSETLPKSTEHLESTTITTTVITSSQESSTNEPVSSSPPNNQSLFSQINIDDFKERNFQKSSENLPTYIEAVTTSSPPPTPEEQPLVQSPIEPTSSESSSAPVNIDTFKERTLQKGSDSRTTSPERPETTVEIVKVTEESHYQSPKTLTESTSQSAEESPSVHVNIDTFKERTLQKGSESRTTSPERSETTTVGKVKTTEESHYQSPSNELITEKDTSIYPQINIDEFRERTFEKSPKKITKTEESPYEIPSGEPVPLVSRSPIDSNTYDTPRSLEFQQITKQETTTTTMVSSGKQVGEISSIQTDPSTSVEKKKRLFVLPKKTKKSKEKTTSKKSNLVPSLLCHKKQKTKIPVLNLPAVERDLSPNNSERPPHRRESDPLHIPAVELPALNFPLPTYDRPEVDMTIGQVKQINEFTVPTVSFSAIPNLEFPEENSQLVIKNENEMNVPSVDLPNVELTFVETKREVKPTQSTIETGLALASPVDDLLSIQTSHKDFPIETDYAIKTETIITSVTTQVIETISQTPEKQVVKSSEAENSNLDFQLPSAEPVLTISKDSKMPPSFDDDVPSPPIQVVPAVQTIEKQQIEPKTDLKKKSSPIAICSCFGHKSSATKEKTRSITAHKTSLPEIDMPLPSSNVSSTLKSKEPLRAPATDLPPLKFTSESSDQSTSPIPMLEQVNLSTKNDNKTAVPSESKKFSSFDIKVPSIDVPPLDITPLTNVDAYSSREHLQTRSDSGLEQTVSSPIQPSSTLADIQQLPSISSGLGSEILDNMTVQGQSVPSLTTSDFKHDFTKTISLNDDVHSKLILRENELKSRLHSEISKSFDDFDEKKDSNKLDLILADAIDLIKNRQISTYPELKEKLLAKHKNDASLVDAVVYSLYYTIENHALDDLDKPEFPLAIRDMVRLPAKQTHDTAVTHLNKESTSLTTTSMTKEILPTVSTVRSCLTCGRTKSKSTLPVLTSPSLLDERHRTELNTHRNTLANTLRDHIQSSQPPIRKFADHPKSIDKIVRKGLLVLSQPKTISYEQVRHDLRTEFKQTFYLIDPIVDIIRDTFDHCDITQLNEKTNLDILDSQISQTAQLYNNQMNLLTVDESNAFNNNQLSWLTTYLISNETTEKKLTKKQIKELNKILQRSLEILSSHTITTWDEFNQQLQCEYPKAQDLCQRATEILKQAQRNGLFLLHNAPVQDKRRASSLITDRARQNLKNNRNQIHASLKAFLVKYYTKTAVNDDELEHILKKTLTYLEEQKPGQFKSYQDLKEQLKKDFDKLNQSQFIEQTVDIIEQAHATNQFDDIEKVEVQSLMKDRLDGKPLIIKEVYVSLPPRVGAYGDESGQDLSGITNGDRTTISYRVGRGLSWREANERARILFYRGKHPAIHYDEQAEGFDVRMLLETASGGTQEIPVTESDVHELLNSCGVQWDGVNIVSLVDHSEDVVRAAEQAALKVIREKGIVELRTSPPASSSNNDDQSSA